MDQETGEQDDLLPRQGIRRHRRIQTASSKIDATEGADRAKRDNHARSRRGLLDLFKGKGKGKFTPPPFLGPTFPFIQFPPSTDVPTTSESILPVSSTTTIETPTSDVAPTTSIVLEPVQTTTFSPLPEVTTTIDTTVSTTDPTTVQTMVTITGPATAPTTALTKVPTTSPITAPTTEVLTTEPATTELPTTEPPTTEPPTTELQTTELPTAPITVPTTGTELSSTFSTFTVSTITLSTTATSRDTPNATYSATHVPMEYTFRPGHIAGIVLGTILGVLLVIALILLHLWKRRQSRRGVDPSAQLWVPETARPKSSHLRWMCQLKQKIPNITLTAAADENEKQTSNQSIGQKSARSIASRLFSRQPSPYPSSHGEPLGIGASGSGGGTPFRNSMISEGSSTWMTPTQGDGEFVPPTALSHPSIPPKARQILNMSEEGLVRAGGPSRWLSPPSWRVSRSRRSLARKTFNGGNHSPSPLSRNPWNGGEYSPSPPSSSDTNDPNRSGSDRQKPDKRGKR